MKRRFWLAGILLGAWSALAVVALLYLGGRLAGLPFVPFDLFDWMARVLPGGIIRFTIDTMIKTIRGLSLGPTSVVAKTAEQLIAIVQFVAGGAILGGVLALFSMRFSRRLTWIGAALGIPGFVLAAAITSRAVAATAGPSPPQGVSILWLVLVFIAWGALLGHALQPHSRAGTTEVDRSRRRFLYITGVGSFTVVVAGLGVKILSRGTEPEPASAGQELNAGGSSSALQPPPPASFNGLAGRIEPVAGTRKELTPNKDFYRVDIDTSPPRIEESSWQLEITGMVQRPLALSLEDLRSRSPASQAVTQECISNPVGGDLISTTIYTGIRLRDLLAEAGLTPGAAAVAIESFDGYYESVPMTEAQDERTLLAYAMNGEPLPREHGFPLRICIPNHYGMKQPKWIRRMDVIDHDGPGYWVDRGWNRSAVVRTTSVIDVADVKGVDPSTWVVPVGGIAFAGSRGISKVEVQADDGPWETAELRIPPLSPLTWVQWRYLWHAAEGRHVLRVRATDGSGIPQEARRTGAFPEGATGLYSLKADVRR
jgi:DMSO/TMAO reductase YedYZ molybdopterin-dependent catalytic subunit